jgi:hypothetical protein
LNLHFAHFSCIRKLGLKRFKKLTPGALQVGREDPGAVRRLLREPHQGKVFFYKQLPPNTLAVFDLTTNSAASRDDTAGPRRQG